MPSDHELSNERLARETLIKRVGIPRERTHPLRSLDVELPDRFDLVLLGIGEDGHTASLFPGRQEVEAAEPVVFVPEADREPYVPRYSLSLALLNAQPLVAFLVLGERKREIVARVLAGDETLPAARVRAETTVMLADEAAAPPR